MKRILLCLSFVALPVAAQLPQPAFPAMPPVTSVLKVPGTPAGTTPNLCDQTFAMLTETDETNRVTYVPGPTNFAIPFPDAQDNHDKAVKVLKEMSKQQNKGGPYTITASETVSCDNRDNVRITEGSLYVEGVTLEGTVAIADVALQMGKEVNDRFRARAKAGLKQGWNHKNAKSVTRNELGQVDWDDKKPKK